MQYGWHGVSVTRALLYDRIRQQIWQDYTATMLDSIGHTLSENWTFPMYRDLIGFWVNKKAVAQEEMSAQDTLEQLKARLRM